MGKGPVAAGAGCFGGVAVSPLVMTEMASDLIEFVAVDLLEDDAAVANEFVGCDQLHGPESYAVVAIPLEIAGDPLLDSGAIERSGIEEHGFGVAQDLG